MSTQAEVPVRDNNNRSDSIGQLAKALASAQGEIRAAAKDRENPFYKSSYATLASVWDVSRGPLSKNGLAVVQSPQQLPDGKMVLETVLAHASGEWMRSVYPVVPVKADPQGYGSAITYARRYSLAAMVGVAADEDDDGNAASGKVTSQKPQEKIAPKKPDEPHVELTGEAHAEKCARLVSELVGATEAAALAKITERLAKEPKSVKENPAVRDAWKAAKARLASKPAANEALV